MNLLITLSRWDMLHFESDAIPRHVKFLRYRVDGSKFGSSSRLFRVVSISYCLVYLHLTTFRLGLGVFTILPASLKRLHVTMLGDRHSYLHNLSIRHNLEFIQLTGFYPHQLYLFVVSFSNPNTVFSFDFRHELDFRVMQVMRKALAKRVETTSTTAEVVEFLKITFG